MILRIKYKKEFNMRYLSHLELIKTMERIFRRMDLPMSFSNGFNPRPKISYAAPLPVGMESECEFLDVELDEIIDIDEFLERHKEYVPRGISFVEARYFEKSKSLMSLVTDSEYIIKIEINEEKSYSDIKEMLEQFLNREAITYEKLNKKKKLVVVDIKDRIKTFELLDAKDSVIRFKTLLTTGSAGNLKPEKLLELFTEYSQITSIREKERIRRIDLFKTNKKGELISLFEE